MTQFRMDNTDGYSADELAELNDAWNALTTYDQLNGMNDFSRNEYFKHLTERLHQAYDAGDRGDALLRCLED